MAASSTMFSKTLTTGGMGGVVYTKDKDLYWRIRSLADRGKPFNKPNFNFRMTTDFLFPSHNFNLDEISCAIGTSVISKLQYIIDQRHNIAKKIDKALEESEIVSPTNLELPGCKSSIYFHTVKVDIDKLKISKVQFANAIAAEGITLNTDYRDITSEWRWIPKYVKDFKKTKNAINFRNKTFNILFNEQFGDAEVEDIIKSILKVEKYYLK